MVPVVPHEKMHRPRMIHSQASAFSQGFRRPFCNQNISKLVECGPFLRRAQGDRGGPPLGKRQSPVPRGKLFLASDPLPEFCLRGGGVQRGLVGGAVGGTPPLSVDPELLEAPKAPTKFFGLN